MALLILSLVTVLAASMTVEHNFTIRRISNQLAMQQGYSYLRGVEAIAQKILRLDLEIDKEDGNSLDHLGELWALEAQPFMLENGDAYTGRIYDLQARFNLNSLRDGSAVTNDGIPAQIPFTIEQGIFIRLLQSFNDDDFQLSEQEAINITEALIDYMDEDRSPRGFSCGEDDAYYSIDGRQAHKTPNLPLTSVSELRLICNMPVVLYERIKDFVTVWPHSGRMSINLNTAAVPILRSVFVVDTDKSALSKVDGKTNYTVPPPLDVDILESYLEIQAVEGFSNFNQLQLELTDASLWPAAPVGLSSDYFLLLGQANIAELTVTMSSVISRQDGTIKFLARSTGGL